MKSIIEELWYGNISPLESDVLNTPQLKELLGYICRHYKELEQTLSDEQKAVFEKLMDNRGEYSALSEAAAFVCGFKLGAQLIIEATAN